MGAYDIGAMAPERSLDINVTIILLLVEMEPNIVTLYHRSI